MRREEFLLYAMAITAFAGNGHDGPNDEDGAWFPSPRVPIRMIWFADGWVIACASLGQAELLGARVLKVGGLSPTVIVAQLRRCVGGTGALKSELRLRDGRRVNRAIAFAPGNSIPPAAAPVQVWMPLPGEAEKGWRAAITESAPLYLEDGTKEHRVKALPEFCAEYVEFRSRLDSQQETIAAFTNSVEKVIAATPLRNLIVDLRFDKGGKSDLTREGVKDVVTRVPDTISLSIGPYTFSAAIVTTDAFKHDGAGRVRIIGGGGGERLCWSAEGRNKCLPFLHCCPHITTGTWDLDRGCGGEVGCYGDRYAVTVGTLSPDIPAPLTATAWLAERDPALEAVRAELPRHCAEPRSAADRSRFPHRPLTAGARRRAQVYGARTVPSHGSHGSSRASRESLRNPSRAPGALQRARRSILERVFAAIAARH